jgi:N-acetylmuramoyl-L-alanine amidase
MPPITPDKARHETNARKLSDVTIVLDAGHDNKDSGAVVDGFKEVDFTRKQTLAIKKELESRGYKVVIASDKSVDTDGDGKVSNVERARFSNTHKNSLFLSIHADVAPVSSSGTVLFYPTAVKDSVNKNSAYWAQGLASALNCGIKTEHETGIGNANGGALAKSKELTDGAAIITVEVLNLKNPQDLKNARSQDFINNYAKQFVDALEKVGGEPSLPKNARSDYHKEAAAKASNSPAAPSPTNSDSQTQTSNVNLGLLASIGAGNSSAFVKAGSTGLEVIEVKKLLNTWLKQQGKAELELTAECDATMVKAIKDFQRTSGLSKELKLFTKGGLVVDGIVGPWTLTALMKANGIEDPRAALAQFNGESFDLMSVLNSVPGGVYVDSTTGEPDWDALADLQFDSNFVPITANRLTDMEIASREAPKAVKDALDYTYKKFEDFDYGWGSIGENGKIDCSAFVSWYLRRLGLKSNNGTWRQTTLQLINAESVFPGQVQKITNPSDLREGDFIVWVGRGDSRHTGVVGPNGVIYHSASRMGGRGVNDNVSVSTFINTASKYKNWACYRPIVAGEVVNVPFPSMDLPEGFNKAVATFYFPPEKESDKKMQGTGIDHKGRQIGTVEGFIAGRDKYITIAIDDVVAEQYDMRRITIPEVEEYYRRKYNLPADFKFDFRIADTGGHFTGGKLGLGAIDICTENRQIAYANGKKNISWKFLEDNSNPGVNPKKPMDGSWRLTAADLDALRRQNQQKAA